MEGEKKYHYTPLPEPIPITEQEWPEDVLPLVTTRTITFMHEPYIRDCIEGILMQKTTFPVQVVIHDDASSDKTADIVKEYEAKFPLLIKAIYQKENQSSKPNRGTMRSDIQNAISGKYIALCEGDDYWIDSSKLQNQVEFLEANPDYSMCFHNAEVKTTEGLLFKRRLFWHLKEKDYSGVELLERWCIPTASVICRAEDIKMISKKPRHPDYMFGDIVLFLNLAESGKLRCINKRMSVYRVHEQGLSNIDNDYKMQRYIKHQLAIQKNFDRKYRYVTHALITKFYFQIGFIKLKKMKFKEASLNLLKGIISASQGVFFAPASFFRMIYKNFDWKY